jgi:hypothetical protein
MLQEKRQSYLNLTKKTKRQETIVNKGSKEKAFYMERGLLA